MAGLLTKTTFAELARKGTGAGSPLVVPVPASGPMSAVVQKEVAMILVADVKKRFSTGTTPEGVKWRPLKYPRPSGGGQPLRDTGRLMASFTSRTTPLEVVVGTNHPGAGLHQFGGTVRPKKGKYLAIPMTREAKRAGSPRRMKGNAKVPLFARKVGGRWVGHFLLVRKAVIPARPFLGVSREALATVGRVLAEATAKNWQQGRVG